MNLSAFKAYDVRGVYPSEVNEDLAYLVGRALVRFLSAKTIVVGRDIRESSPTLSEKMIEGINCEGADVIDLGLCTTPMLNFAVSNYGYDGGVMISASHSPADMNAFKLVSAKDSQLDEGTGLSDIKGLVEKGFSDCPGKGTTTEKDVLSDYLGQVLKVAEGMCPLKVVVDYGNGVGSVSAKPAFARLDFDLTEMYEEPDGKFPNHPANPHDLSNFEDLKAKVHEKEADLGIFFDGDADRAIFVDDLGRVVPTDLLTVLLAQEELREKPNQKIFYDLRFSKAVPELVKKAGGIPQMMRVGNPFYKRALKKEGLLGAEFSGHIMFAENYGIDDGLFASLKVMKLLCEKGKKLSELIDEVTIFRASPEESIETKNPETVYERLVAEFPEAKQIELDGCYLDFPDGFISVRQSQTEPQLFRLRVEAKKEDVLTERLEKVRNILKL